MVDIMIFRKINKATSVDSFKCTLPDWVKKNFYKLIIGGARAKTTKNKELHQEHSEFYTVCSSELVAHLGEQ